MSGRRRGGQARGSDRLASAGVVLAVGQFVTAWAVLGAGWSDYDPARQALSELAAQGAPSRGPMTAALVVFAILVGLFAPTVRRAFGAGAAVAVAVNAVGTAGVALLPCSPGCPGPGAGPLDLAHVAAAVVAYAGLAAAPLVAAPAARGAHAVASWVLGVLTVGLLAVWAAGAVPELAGVWQRAATTAGDAWYVVAAVRCWRSPPRSRR